MFAQTVGPICCFVPVEFCEIRKRGDKVKNHAVMLVGLLFCSSGYTGSTPMGEKIPAGVVSRIECEFDQNIKLPKWALECYRGVDENSIPALSKQTVFNYDVLLPDCYHENPERRYPCMFISSPGGNAKAGAMEARLRRDKWIAIMLVESKNGTNDWLRNFVAAHDDAVKRFRIQEGMKYATGFSGGARCSSIQTGVRPGFAGMILQGAAFAYFGSTYIYESVKNDKYLAVCMIMGLDDSNKREIATLGRELPRHTPLKIITFKGGHVWAPSESLDEAMDWMDEQLLLTTNDRDIARLMFNSRAAALKRVEDNYARYESLSVLSNIAAKHKLQGFPDTAEVMGSIKAEMAELKKDKGVLRELKAKTAYDAVYTRERKMMDGIASGKIKENRVDREKQKLIEGYRAFIGANKDTYHAGKAQERIEKLGEGLAEK